MDGKNLKDVAVEMQNLKTDIMDLKTEIGRECDEMIDRINKMEGKAMKGIDEDVKDEIVKEIFGMED